MSSTEESGDAPAIPEGSEAESSKESGDEASKAETGDESEMQSGSRRSSLEAVYVISEEEHAENVEVSGEMVDIAISQAAQGMAALIKEKVEEVSDFAMKEHVEGDETLLADEEVTVEMHPVVESVEELPEVDEKLVEEVQAMLMPHESWLMMKVKEDEEYQEALDLFRQLHDENIERHIENLLLQSRASRILQGRKPPGGEQPREPLSLLDEAKEAVMDSINLRTALCDYQEVLDEYVVECDRVSEEELLRKQRDDSLSQVDTYTAEAQQLERSVFNRLHRVTVDQDCERLRKQFWTQLERLRGERLKNVRLLEAMSSLRSRVSKLETFGEDYDMGSYEHLVAEIHGTAEKVEEREEQLVALRAHAENDIQTAAHLRELLVGTRAELRDLRKRTADAAIYLHWTRKEVMKAKFKRDVYRKENQRLSRQMGLLGHLQLLRDYQETLWRVSSADEQLASLRETYDQLDHTVADVQRHIVERSGRLGREVPEGVLLLDARRSSSSPYGRASLQLPRSMP